MKATVVGYSPYDFPDEKTGKQKTGISLYVVQANPNKEGLRGKEIVKYSVNGGTALYADLMSYEFKGQFETNLDVMVGANGKGVLADMTIPGKN